MERLCKVYTYWVNSDVHSMHNRRPGAPHRYNGAPIPFDLIERERLYADVESHYPEIESASRCDFFLAAVYPSAVSIPDSVA